MTEKLAMRLTVEAGQYSAEEIPEAISSIGLDEADKRLSPADMQAKAQTLVFDNNYMHAKDKIRENVSLCTQSLIRSSSQELENASAKLSLLVQMQTVMTIIFSQ